MEFIRDCEYYRTKIARIKEAIQGTQERLKRLKADGAPQRQIEAHRGQLDAQKKQLLKAQEEYGAFLGKQIDQEEG